MSNANKEPLFRLVKTLSKSEKRHFRLYVNRTMGNQERKFLALFDLLDKQDQYDFEQLLQKLPGKTTRTQLSNLKRHLFKQLLTSLRLTYINKLIDIEIREQLDFARILYSKGLYMESLRLLERIKDIANEHHQDILHLEIIEFQKLIESRHITRSRQKEKKMERLLEESSLRSRITQTASEMVNLHIQIHGYYIVHGFAHTPEQLTALHQAWRTMQPLGTNRFADTFFERAHRYQSYLWYRYIQLDFKGALSHALEWVMLFRLHEAMKYKDPDLYLRSLYYLLTLLYFTNDYADYERYLQQMIQFVNKEYEQLNLNSQHVSFVYQSLCQLNFFFLQRDYQSAFQLVPELASTLEQHRALMDPQRILLFYYKFAAAALGAGYPQEALMYLHPVLHQSNQLLQKALEFNARLLELICLYETQAFDRMSYRLISFGRSVAKSKSVTPLQLATQKLLRALLQLWPNDPSEVVTQYLQQFQAATAQAREQLFLKNLDIIYWLEQKK